MHSFNSAITTVRQLESAEVSTILLAVVLCLIFVIALYVIANMISWKPGAVDPSRKQRKSVYWILGIVLFVLNLGIDWYMFLRHITKTNLWTKYMAVMIGAAFVSMLVYYGASYVWAKMLNRPGKPETKMGSIFPKK